MENYGATKTPTDKALAMLDAFASIGVRSFDITFTNVKEDEHGRQEFRGFRENRSIEQARRSMPYLMANAPKRHNNIIIRPHDPPCIVMVQLDDLDITKSDRVKPHAFMIIRTSAGQDGTGNYQAWVALSDGAAGKEAAEDFARRLRKGAGADRTASGATRIAGSLNFKIKYAPAFPRIEITYANPGYLSSCAALEQAGLVAHREDSRPPLPAYTPPMTPSGRFSRKKWPDYNYCVKSAPLAHGDNRPDLSRADFTWCRTAIEWGWSKEETARRLMDFSSKARNNEHYAILTATNAAASVERQPYRDRSTPRPS
jgi:hypothetical protein